MKKKLDKIILDDSKKGSSAGVKTEADQVWSLDIKEYVKLNNLRIKKEFL